MYKQSLWLVLMLVLALCFVGCDGQVQEDGAADAADVEAAVEEVEEDAAPQEQYVLFEDFSGLTSIDEFWTAEYKLLPGDQTKPLYVPIEGEFTLENGKLKMIGSRFTIGTDRTTETTKEDTEAGGYLDLTKPYRVTVSFLEVGGDTNKKFSVMIDNNTTTGAASMHGNPGCRPYNERLSLLPAEKTIVIDVDPAVGTENSFLQLRVEAGTGWILLDSITVEYLP
ncbi:MAG: hypothetical protein GX228_01790 [Firmicutes bacterium]|jgi:hypothetical protein|nr:hypothetical protein [Bacillota bacterium]